MEKKDAQVHHGQTIHNCHCFQTKQHAQCSPQTSYFSPHNSATWAHLAEFVFD